MNRPSFHLRSSPKASLTTSVSELVVTLLVILLIGWVFFLFFNAGLILIGKDQRLKPSTPPAKSQASTIVVPVETRAITAAVVASTPLAKSAPLAMPGAGKTPAPEKTVRSQKGR